MGSMINFKWIKKRPNYKNHGERLLVPEQLQTLAHFFYPDELTVRQKQSSDMGPVCFNCFGPQGPPIPPLIIYTSHLWDLSSCLFTSSDQAFPLVDTEISIGGPRGHWNVVWPSSISLYIGLCSPCPEQPTNQCTRPVQEGEGSLKGGGSQWAPALDWSRHNYHVNILLCIRWYNAHTLSGSLFPHQSHFDGFPEGPRRNSRAGVEEKE